MNDGKVKYLREVRKWLPCSRKMKNRIMDQIGHSMEAWLEENAGAGYAQIQAHFGSPRQIAATYIDNLATDELLRDLRIKRKIMRSVTAAVIAFILILAIAVSAMVVDARNDRRNGHTITSTYER